MQKGFLVLAILLCSASRLHAQPVLGTWPVGGGPITITPIDGPHSTYAFEFASRGGDDLPGLSAAPFEFFISSSDPGQPTSRLVIRNLFNLVTIDDPITLDIHVSPLASADDLFAFCTDDDSCAFPVRMVPEPNSGYWLLLVLLGFRRLRT